MIPFIPFHSLHLLEKRKKVTGSGTGAHSFEKIQLIGSGQAGTKLEILWPP
jgi:hypothetical protein